MTLELQLDISVRLLIASVLGAAIGFEREVHGHPAGMRTHLLVSLGSALFTVLSIFGFPPGEGEQFDPSRVAAQIVSGIGFLGAGAIIKDGFSVRGLTTAASLWATAAVGMGAGAGNYVVTVVATGIVLFSLWPLNRVADRVHGRQKERGTIRVEVRKRGAVTDACRLLTDQGIEIVSIETNTDEEGRLAFEIGVRVKASARLAEALAGIRALDDVESVAANGLARG